ncbi:Nst1, partial [Ophiophagus hannah]
MEKKKRRKRRRRRREVGEEEEEERKRRRRRKGGEEKEKRRRRKRRREDGEEEEEKEKGRWRRGRGKGEGKVEKRKRRRRRGGGEWKEEEEETFYVSNFPISLSHPFILITGIKQLFRPYPKICKGSIQQGQLSHPAPVPVGQRLGGAVAAPERILFGDQGLQFWRGPSRHQSPYQGENIVIEDPPNKGKTDAYRTHEGIQDTNREGRSAGKRLGEIEFCVGVIIIILIQELNVRIIY